MTNDNNDFYTLIANSGVQFMKLQIELNPNDNVVKPLRFFEPFRGTRQLEFAEYIADEDIWVSRSKLFEAGYLDENGRIMNDISSYILDMETVDPEKEGYSINTIDTNIRGAKDREKTALEHFENKWLPLPYFEEMEEGTNLFGPTNWARIKLVPRDSNDINRPRIGSRYYEATIIFDTNVKYGEDMLEYPTIFENTTVKIFSLCSSKDELLKYVMDRSCCWIDEYLIKLVHGDEQYINKSIETGGIKDIFEYKAYYIYLMYYLQAKNIFRRVRLFTDKDVEKIDVDIVLDIGNSRTCGLLFENSDFTKVKMLELQDYTNTWRSYSDPFDMRLAFRKADFGEIGPPFNTQFIIPSILRVGEEASWLIYNAQTMEDGNVENVTNYSSPKRYLWDDEKFKKQWNFILLKGEPQSQTTVIYLKGISEQFKQRPA
jgi:hypothetical protein